MSNDVERLADLLAKVHYGKTLVEMEQQKYLGAVLILRRDAEGLIAAGVTLPTPPRVTPLEAAARARCKRNGSTPWNELTPTEQRAWLTDTAEDITAAVGALSDVDGMPGWVLIGCTPVFRAALLARLTEGGTA